MKETIKAVACGFLIGLASWGLCILAYADDLSGDAEYGEFVRDEQQNEAAADPSDPADPHEPPEDVQNTREGEEQPDEAEDPEEEEETPAIPLEDLPEIIDQILSGMLDRRPAPPVLAPEIALAEFSPAAMFFSIREITGEAANSAMEDAKNMKPPNSDAVYFYKESDVGRPYVLMYATSKNTGFIEGSFVFCVVFYGFGEYQADMVAWQHPGFSAGGIDLAHSADYYLESVSDIKLNIPVEYWATIVPESAQSTDPGGGSGPRPFLTTPFEDYTVLEGLSLVFLLCLVFQAVYHMFRRFV